MNTLLAISLLGMINTSDWQLKIAPGSTIITIPPAEEDQKYEIKNTTGEAIKIEPGGIFLYPGETLKLHVEDGVWVAEFTKEQGK